MFSHLLESRASAHVTVILEKTNAITMNTPTFPELLLRSTASHGMG